MALRSGMTTCGKWKDGTDWSSLRVRYINDRQLQGASVRLSVGSLSGRLAVMSSHKVGSMGGSGLNLRILSKV
jgi:hypothetical protein